MADTKLQETGGKTIYVTLPAWIKELWKWEPGMKLERTFNQREQSVTIKKFSKPNPFDEFASKK